MSRAITSLICGLAGLSASVAGAVTVYPAQAPYTFTGTVVSATGPCPYAAKTTVAGYTGFGVTNNFDFATGKPIVSFDFRKSPGFVFSPGGTAAKTDYILHQMNFVNGSTIASGGATLVYLPSTSTTTGTYKFNFNTVTPTSFKATLTMTITTTGTCKTAYALTFTKGLPKSIFDIL